MDKFNSLSWSVATVLLIGCGLYYSFKLHFPQFHFKQMYKSIKKDKNDSDGISPFETLTLSLAARIGVGSLAGIAIGIYKGGIGTIFWLLLSSLITLPNSFVESTLAVIYRKKDGKYYKGGPSYYINSGLGFKKLSIVYAMVICLCYLGGFLAIQSNTISLSLKTYLNIPTIISGILIALLAFMVIYKGIKRIAKFTSFFVPIMGIGYLLITLYIIFSNINLLPNIFINIIKSAFNINSFGYGILTSIIIGIQRGIFSNESGIGTGAVSSGTSNTKYPIKQGYLQMIGVYFTTFVVCTVTSLVILTSNVNLNSFNDINGIEITLMALKYHLGDFGTTILIFTIFAFAFSTIASGYYYGESNIKYLFKNINNKGLLILKIIVVIIILYGSIMSPSKLWNFVDIGVGILAIINSIAIFLLRKDIMEEMYYAKKYNRE